MCFFYQLVPAVTELVIAELLYLQWLDPRQPTYVYINSTGTSRADGETVFSLRIAYTCPLKSLCDESKIVLD